MRNRFVPEQRNELFEDEWCIVDEDIAPVGSCIKTGLTREEAFIMAKDLNQRLGWYKDAK